MGKIKALMLALEKASERMEAVEQAYTEDYMNAELEEEFDRTYAVEWNIRKELATEISLLTGIDFKFAFHELTYSPKFAELIKSISI